MFEFRLERILRLLTASYLLTQLDETAHFECTMSILSLTVSSISPHFIAKLRLDSSFFVHYSLSGSLCINWRICLNHFCHHLREAMSYSSMSFSLPYNNLPIALSTLNDPLRGTVAFVNEAVYREMLFSYPEDQEDVGKIMYETFVSIDSEEFKHIIMEFSDIRSNIHVTMRNLHVKFSNALKEIIITPAESECIIGGVGVGEQYEFEILLHPSTFFQDLTSRVERVWLYKTDKARGVIKAPIDSNVGFEIYFDGM